MYAIPQAKPTWIPGDELESVFDEYGGDVVQAIQALKESNPEKTILLRALLQELLSRFGDCRAYCQDSIPALDFPFSRAERQVADVLELFYPGTVPPTLDSGLNTIVASFSERAATVETFQAGPVQMPRLLNGLWQLSSPAWGSASAENQYRALLQLVQNGLTAADMADHYVRMFTLFLLQLQNII